jgi:hypothetical protein
MKTFDPTVRCALLLLSLATATAPALAVQGDAAAAVSAERHLLYVPSATADNQANVAGLQAEGFRVTTLPAAGDDTLRHARRVAGQVRLLLSQGIAPAHVTVVGVGGGAPVATLASAIAGNRHVNYVLLGRCEPLLKVDYRFRMSGRVLAVRDAQGGSPSCRPLWVGSPRVSARRDLVLDSGLGAALFDQPRAQWLQPVVQWSRGSRVDVGAVSNDVAAR